MDPFEALGAVPVDDSSDVDVVYADGTTASLPRTQADLAIATGARLASDVAEERAHAEQQAEYGTGADQAIAGVGGLLRGASLGLTDAITAGTVGAWNAITGGSVTGGEGPTLTPEARARAQAMGIPVPEQDTRSAFARGYDAAIEYQQAVRAANPVTAIGSEVAGGAGAALLSGGSSLAAATPAGALARGGAALAGKLGGGAIARGAAAGAIEGGIAGLALGATRTTSEELEDPWLLAQRIFAEAGTGLALGGVAGGGLSAIAQAARRTASGAKSVASKIAPRPPEIAAPPTDDFASVTQELRSRPLRSDQLPELQRGRFKAIVDSAKMADGGFDDVVAAETKRIDQALNTIQVASDNVDNFSGIAAKKTANKLLSRADVGIDAPAVGSIYDDLAGQIDGFVSGMGEQALSFDAGLANVRKLRKLIDENKRLSLEAFGRGDVGEAFSLIDQTKRTLGKAAKNLRNEPVREMLRDLYPRVQRFLEQENLWGEMAARQKMANPAWSNAIRHSRDSVVKRFTVRGHKPSVNEWDDTFRSNDVAVRDFLRGELGTPGLGANEEAWRKYLLAAAEDATARTQAWGSQAMREEAVRMNRAVKDIFDSLDVVALAKRDALRGGALLNQTSAEAMMSSVPTMSRASGALNAGRRLAIGIAKSGQGAAARVAKAADSVLSRISKSAERASSGAGVPAALAAQPMSDDMFNDRLAESLALGSASSPETVDLFAAAADLEGVDPDVAESMVMTALQRAQLIADKMPKPNHVAIYAPGPVLSPASDRALRRTVDAAYDPVAAIERVAKLAHSPEDVEALKRVFPALWADFQQRVEDRLRSPKGQKNAPSSRERIALSVALGLPLDPSMQPEKLAASQVQAQQPLVQDEGRKNRDAVKGPRLGGLDKRDDVFASPVDRILDQR